MKLTFTPGDSKRGVGGLGTHLLSSGLSDSCEAPSSLHSLPSFFRPSPTAPLPDESGLWTESGGTVTSGCFLTSLWSPCAEVMQASGTVSCQGKHCRAWGLAGRLRVSRPRAGGPPVGDGQSVSPQRPPTATGPGCVPPGALGRARSSCRRDTSRGTSVPAVEVAGVCAAAYQAPAARYGHLRPVRSTACVPPTPL